MYLGCLKMDIARLWMISGSRAEDGAMIQRCACACLRVPIKTFH